MIQVISGDSLGSRSQADRPEEAWSTMVRPGAERNNKPLCSANIIGKSIGKLNGNIRIIPKPEYDPRCFVEVFLYTLSSCFPLEFPTSTS